MKYSTGIEIKVGDSVKIHHGEGGNMKGKVINIILPNTSDTKD